MMIDSFVAKVVPGKQVGRKLGYPTINLVGSYTLEWGVYACVVKTAKGVYKGALHYGPRGSSKEVILEVHLLDFSDDLYDETVRIEVYNRLRDTQRFDDINELKAQIGQDVEAVRKLSLPL